MTMRTPEVAKTICDELEKGRSLRAICRGAAFPSKAFVLDWASEDAAFADQYARARERGWHDRAEAAVAKAKSAKDASLGRLAFDAERWLLSKMMPKVYGERVAVEHSVTDTLAEQMKAARERAATQD